MIKIYFNNKPLILSTALTPELASIKENAKTIVATGTDTEAIRNIIQQLQEPSVEAGIITHPSLDALFDVVSQQFTLVKAAGGFVFTPDQKILFIFRRGKWDLPKGKLDEEEELAACALREVAEETGLINLQLQQPLIISYHTYYEGKKHILKESHWYVMLAERPNAFTPQTEEDITACRWVDLEYLNSVLNNTHPSIIDVVRAGKEYLKNRK